MNEEDNPPQHEEEEIKGFRLFLWIIGLLTGAFGIYAFFYTFTKRVRKDGEAKSR